MYTGLLTVKFEAISLTEPTFDITSNLFVTCSKTVENNIELIKSRFENNRLPQDLKFKVTLYTGEELVVSTTTSGFTASTTHNKGEWKWGWNASSSSWRVKTFDDSEVYTGWNTVSAKYVKGDITIQKELVFDILAYAGVAQCYISCGSKKETVTNSVGAIDNVFEISRYALPAKPGSGTDEISIDISDMIVAINNKRILTSITYKHYTSSEFDDAFTIKHIGGNIPANSYRIEGDSIILPGSVRNTGCNLALKAVFNDFINENGREANMPFFINIL